MGHAWVTVLGIDCPAVAGAPVTAQARASALVSLRIPPGTNATHAQDHLAAHLADVASRGVRISIERDLPGAPFAAQADGPATACSPRP